MRSRMDSVSCCSPPRSSVAPDPPCRCLAISVLWLTAFCLLEFINPESPMIRSLAGFRSWIVYTWLVFAGYNMLQSRRQLQQIYAALIALSIVTALYGIYQWKQGPAALMGQSAVLDQYATKMDWTEQGTGRSVFRAFSTFGLPGAFGHNMAMGLLVAVVVLCSRGVPRYLRSMCLLGAPLMLAALAASGARSPAVMLAVGLLVIISLRGGRVSLPLMLVAGAGLWATATLVSSSLASRYATILDVEASIQKWWLPLARGLAIAADNPFGKGLGYTAGMPWLLSGGKGFAGIETTNVDSGIGVAAAELGFFGLAIFLLFLIQLARRPLQTWRQLPEGTLKDLLLAPVTFSLVFALTSVITVISASLPFSIYMWLLLGMVFKAPYLPVEESQSTMPGVQPVHSASEPPSLELLPSPLMGRMT
jgi:O-antigen ligase